MQQIIASFAKTYRMTMTEVTAEIERVFSVTLSKWYGTQVLVFFRDDMCLEAVAYNKVDGVVMQRVIDLTTIRGINTLKKQLNEALAMAVLFKQTKLYKCYERELRWGEITSRDAENNLYVEIELCDEKVTAICPSNRLGLHERNSRTLSIGDRRAFHLRSVEPVLLNGTYRLSVVVDRVSKTLVETLLKYQLSSSTEKISIRCINRYVGHKSFILSSRRLPKSAIIAVTRELGENLEVTFH